MTTHGYAIFCQLIFTHVPVLNKPFLKKLFKNFVKINNMDFPHTPTTPLQIYEAVTSEANSLWYYIQQRDIPGMKPEIRWKKQCYGAWCTIRWFLTSYCHCKDKTKTVQMASTSSKSQQCL